MTNIENLISIRSGLVWIENMGPLNRDNLQIRIQNIREQRHEYITEKAWLRTLQSSINALNMLDATHKEAQNG